MKRRNFFKVSVAAGGGMVLGFNLFSCQEQSSSSSPLAEILEMPDVWHDINAYIQIGNNGIVTIFSQNPEIGQNIKTSMPMIVAEELEVAWEKVVVKQAPLDTDAFERQVAGGSQSIRQGWLGLRTAGATVREMLIATAAERWGLEASQCRAENGVVYGPDDQHFGYGELAEEAAEREVPENVPFKEKQRYKIIGKPTANVELNSIITGKPLFGIDTKKEGMLYAALIRPPKFGQTLKSFDAADAKAVTGIKDVVQMGDKIAVLATSTWPTLKAKKLVQATYSSDSELESTEQHDQELTAMLDNSSSKPFRNDGDVERAFQEADQVLSRVYESPFLPHSCLEPMNFFAHVTDEKVHMQGPIQTPAWARSRAAKIINRDEKDIEVQMTRMGGGFGRRLYGDFSDEAAELSNLIKKPVQLVFSREDDMAAGTYRPAIKYKIEASVKDGTVTGYRLSEASINSNMYGLIPNFFPAGAIPNLRISGQNYSSKISTGAWRAPYTNFLAYAEQHFFDELAELMGKDEVDLRLELLDNAKETAKTDDSIEYNPGRMQECIKLVTEKAGWGNKRDGVFHGISAYYSHNTHVAEVAEVVLEDRKPVVKKIFCAVDCGIVINPEGAINQIEGGIIDGLGHAMYGDMKFEKGAPSISNFHNYRLIRNQEAPDIEVHFVESSEDPTGLGEPSLPPVGGAVANAIYKATGKRMYKQPFTKETAVLGEKMKG